MMRAIFGSIWKIILLLSEFWIIGSFRGHFQALTSKQTSKMIRIYIWLKAETKTHQKKPQNDEKNIWK